MDQMIICGVCRTHVEHGVLVCRGCRSLVEYGAPREAYLGLAVVAGFLAIKAGAATVGWFGWVTFFASLVAGAFLLNFLFRDRIVFKYRR